MLSGISGKQSFGKAPIQAKVDTEKLIQNYIQFNLAKYGLTSTGDPNQDLININNAKKKDVPEKVLQSENQFAKNTLRAALSKELAGQFLTESDQIQIMALTKQFAAQHPEIYRQALDIHKKDQPDALYSMDAKTVVKGAGIALEALQILLTAYQIYDKASQGDQTKGNKLALLA